MTTVIEKRIKYYRYRVTKVNRKKGTGKASVKVGAVLLYKHGRGPTHVELIMNTKGQFCETWHMEKIGVCWAVGNKVVEVIDQ